MVLFHKFMSLEKLEDNGSKISEEDLTPSHFAALIHSIAPYSLVRAVLIEDPGCVETCRHYDCGTIIPVQQLDFTRKDDGRIKTRITGAAVHSMEEHGSFRGHGSITGRCEMNPLDLDRIFDGT